MATENYNAGIDVGASYIKAVIINNKKEVIGSSIKRLDADLQKSINQTFNSSLSNAVLTQSDISYVTATGFGRVNISFADSIKTEISAHAKGVSHYFPTKKCTIIDIGGQDTKIIKIDEHGKTLGFKMNRKCAAGTGAFLEEIANKLNIPLTDIDKIASKSAQETALSSFCTVFASTEILTRIKEGEKTEDMLKSAFESIAKRVIEMDTLEGTIVMTGGVVAHNDIILKILEKHIGQQINIPPQPQLTGAFGAALFAYEAAKD